MLRSDLCHCLTQHGRGFNAALLTCGTATMRVAGDSTALSAPSFISVVCRSTGHTRRAAPVRTDSLTHGPALDSCRTGRQRISGSAFHSRSRRRTCASSEMTISSPGLMRAGVLA